ncbi:Fe(3+) dicitrate transport protein FecA [Dyella sp. AD56]|nr:Fe(3+) dicitrate transport protein FecA [Dyella sp. AD56]
MSHAWWALVLSGWLCWGTSHAGGLQSTIDMASGASAGLYRFDIGPQPLSAAVKAFSDATGQSLLVDERLLVGKMSPGVRGEFTTEDALRRLLAGTGLRERYASDKAFTLESFDSANERSTNEHSSPDESDTAWEVYGASLQASLEQELCRVPDAKPGGYRLALQVWVDEEGRVNRVRLLGSTGLQARDAAISQALEGIRVAPPPSGLGQPMTLLLLPTGKSHALHCDTPVAARG